MGSTVDGIFHEVYERTVLPFHFFFLCFFVRFFCVVCRLSFGTINTTTVVVCVRLSVVTPTVCFGIIL